MSRRSDRAFWRGYNVQAKEWMYGSLAVVRIGNEEYFIILPWSEIPEQPDKDLNRFLLKGSIVDRYSIGQYTGYDDVEGSPIFEGDYIKSDCDYGPEWHLVDWEDVENTFHLYEGSEGTRDEEFIDYMVAYDNEVAGNAYECNNGLKDYPWEKSGVKE